MTKRALRLRQHLCAAVSDVPTAVRAAANVAEEIGLSSE